MLFTKEIDISDISLEHEILAEHWKRAAVECLACARADEEAHKLARSSTREFIEKFNKYINNELHKNDTWYIAGETVVYLKLIRGSYVDDALNELSTDFDCSWMYDNE